MTDLAEKPLELVDLDVGSGEVVELNPVLFIRPDEVLVESTGLTTADAKKFLAEIEADSGFVLPPTLDEESAYKTYLNAIGQMPLLDSGQMATLAKIRDAGNIAQQQIEAGRRNRGKVKTFTDLGERARNQMLLANLKLISRYAREKRGSVDHLELVDLMQYGFLGLHQAVDKFDPDKGFKFSTYATFWIKQAIQKSVYRYEDLIHRPRDHHEFLQSVSNLKEERLQFFGEETTDEEVAVIMGIPIDKLHEYVGFAVSQRSVDSLDQPQFASNPDSETIGDNVADIKNPYTIDVVEDAMVRKRLAALIEAEITPEELEVLRHTTLADFYGIERKTYDELANTLGLSHGAINGRRNRGLKKLAASDDLKILLEIA